MRLLDLLVTFSDYLAPGSGEGLRSYRVHKKEQLDKSVLLETVNSVLLAVKNAEKDSHKPKIPNNLPQEQRLRMERLVAALAAQQLEVRVTGLYVHLLNELKKHSQFSDVVGLEISATEVVLEQGDRKSLEEARSSGRILLISELRDFFGLGTR